MLIKCPKHHFPSFNILKTYIFRKVLVTNKRIIWNNLVGPTLGVEFPPVTGCYVCWFQWYFRMPGPFSNTTSGQVRGGVTPGSCEEEWGQDQAQEMIRRTKCQTIFVKKCNRHFKKNVRHPLARSVWHHPGKECIAPPYREVYGAILQRSAWSSPANECMIPPYVWRPPEKS